MKKSLLFAALFAASLFTSAQAQQNYRYVTPVNVVCKQFNLQILRDSAVSETQYAAELNALLKDLNDEKNEIDNCSKNLKYEKNLYSSMTDSYKTRKKQLASTQKNYEKDLKVYESLIKDVQKQMDIVRRMNSTDGSSVKDHSARLDRQQEQYKTEMKYIKSLLDELTKSSNTELNGTFTMLNDFLIELTDKETRLKNIIAQNKTNIEIVKTAQKSAKASK